MPDKRLIDANALLEELGERYLATDPSDPEQLGYLYSRVIVRNQPTIDAVEVVRCKDCKYAFVNHISNPLICCKTKMVGTNDPDWFCAAGERKMDGGAEG